MALRLTVGQNVQNDGNNRSTLTSTVANGAKMKYVDDMLSACLHYNADRQQGPSSHRRNTTSGQALERHTEGTLSRSLKELH
jgi:hypothetical protein